MRGFLALLRKEWNDVRVITFACMALVVVTLFAVRWIMQEMIESAATDPNWGPRYMEFLVPFCVGAFVTLAAADLVGREVESRRIDALALLPARPLRIWTAKASVLLATVLVFATWTILAQVIVLCTVDGIDAAFPFLAHAERIVPIALPIAALAGATFLVSSVGFRGIAAAFLGVLVTGALFGLAYGYFLHIGIPESGAFNDDRVFGASATIAVASLVAAAAVFSRGRLHLGRSLRPALGAVATFGLVAIVPTAAYPHALYGCDPDDPETKLSWALPSPDGRTLACSFYRERGGVHGLALHLLDIETGRLQEIGRAHPEPSDDERSAWVDATHLRVVRFGFTSLTHVIVDTKNGTEVELSEESLDEFRRRHTSYRQPATTWTVVGSRTLTEDGATVHVATLRRRSDQSQVQVRSMTEIWSPSASGLLLLCPDRHHVVERDLENGTDRTVLTCDGSIKGLWHTQRADRTVFVRIDDAWEAVRVGDGSRVPIYSGAKFPSQVSCTGSDRRLVWLPSEDAVTGTLADIDTGDRLPRKQQGSLAALPDGRFVLTDWDGACDLLDAKLQVVRRLWPQAGN